MDQVQVRLYDVRENEQNEFIYVGTERYNSNYFFGGRKREK